MEILNDGSVKGKTFSCEDYKGGYPKPKIGDTYSDYHNRVKKHVELGFHLGDLSWGDYNKYCMGSGHYDNFDSNQSIKF